MTAIEGLTQLLDWINDGDRMPAGQARGALAAFVRPWADISRTGEGRWRETGYTAPSPFLADWGAHLTVGQLRGLRRDVRALLADLDPTRDELAARKAAVRQASKGGNRARLDGGLGWSLGTLRRFPSLRFAAVQVREERPKVALATAEERRAALGPGHYAVVVDGRLRDVLLYLILRHLTGPETSRLLRCHAKAPHADRECGRWFTWDGTGRPRVYCSDNCRQRHYQHKAV